MTTCTPTRERYIKGGDNERTAGGDCSGQNDLEEQTREDFTMTALMSVVLMHLEVYI